MGTKANFSADRLAGFKCEAGKQQSIFWDAKTPGLGLRVTAKEAKSFIFETRLHGKTIRLTIGSVLSWQIGEAQAEARRLKVLTDQGIDPRQVEADKKTKRAADELEVERKAVTLGDVWPDYLKDRKAKWGDRHYLDHVRLASAGGVKRQRAKSETKAGPLASLMSVRLADLNGARIAEWLTEERKTRPTSAAQAFRLLRAFIRWLADSATYKDIVPEGAHTARAVTDVLPKSKPKKGDSLQREQLSAWFKAVRSLSNPVQSVYLQALLISGARREEMAGLRWDDVDFQWRSLSIRDKVEGRRTIPLTPYLASLLRDLKAHADAPKPAKLRPTEHDAPDSAKPSQWVFSSPTAKGGRIAEPRIAHNSALATAGLPHVSLHGLRRSFGTLCEWVEVPSGISAQIMGHKPSALVEKHYRDRPLDLLRMWHDKIEAWMLEQAGIKFTPKQKGLKVVRAAR